MKKIIYVGLLCLTYLTTFAQEAEQIDLGPYGALNVRTNKKPFEYFETQINLWEKKVKQNKKDANAWLNYFAATKCAWQIQATKKIEEIQLKQDSKIGIGIDMSKSEYQYKTIAQEAYEILPNSFEANYMMHFADNFMIKRDYSYLLKTQTIRPYDIKILDALIRYYYLINDTENIKKLAFEIVNNNLISDKEYNLAYNILSELDDHAILITTYYNIVDFLILQHTKNIKPNVIIATKNVISPINQIEHQYTDSLLKRIGIERRIQEIVISGRNQKEIEEKFKETQRNYIQDVFNVNKPIYVANNALSLFKDEFGSKLYLHGLTHRYLKKPFNYIYVIKENYEKKYSLDYIKHDISQSPIDDYEKSLYSIYYLSARRLQQFYKSKNMYLQQKEMEDFIHVLAEKAGKEFIGTLEYIDRKIEYSFIAEKIDFEKIDASFVALSAVDHIGKFEITNGEYNLFLNNLKKTKNFELYYRCLIDSVGWERTFVYSYHDPMTDTYGWHPAYKNYPVVNIPYEGAVEYCKWLTMQYNQQHPEGKHVTFRLPTEEEWRYAAGAKNAKAITPFPNNNIATKVPKSYGSKNSNVSQLDGTEFSICYLGNIKTDSMRYQDDGGFHTVKSESYAPNSIGIYNTFGNVAEMTSTKGVIKGGSWADFFSECTFDKNATYAAPDPRVGFRMMMEVIPEIKHNTVVKIEKNVYCFQYEEKVRDYWSYLKEIIELYGINSIEYKNAFPDSTLWKSENIQALKNVLNIAQMKDTSMIIRTLEKTFVKLDTLAKTQLDNYLKYKSDLEFKNYLIENEYIKNLHMQNNPPIFTREAYYAGKLDSICLKEKFMFYPVVSVPTEKQKQLANIYTQKQLEKGEYAPTNPNSIYSSYVNHTYFDKVKHKSKTFPGGNYSVYELKEGVKLSDIKPFELWENYRFVLTWKQWTPNKTK